MDKWGFGISMAVVGMGGTLLSLAFVSLTVFVLTRIANAFGKDKNKEGAQ